jgi:leucyl-tRNA synthetase
MQNKLESFYRFAQEVIGNAKVKENGHLEKWLMSVLQHRISEVTENLEQMKTRTALEIALFETWNDFRWYMRRKGKKESIMLKEALRTWLKLLAPFAPHICEELWSQMQEKGFISTAEWPQSNTKQVDISAEEQENLIKEVIEDTLNVLKATKITPKKIFYYTASPWKWTVYWNVLEKSKSGEVKLNEIMKELAADEELKRRLKEVAGFASKMVKEVGKIPEKRRSSMMMVKALDEEKVIEDAKDFLMQRFNAQITVYKEEDDRRYDPKNKASVSVPYRPAIYIE